jgi:hypothetical protein
MATDVATADAEKKPGTDSKPKAVEDKHDGTGAASTMPAVQRCPGASLGERQVQAQAAPGNTGVGAADDAAEHKADMAAGHVMRQMDKPPAAAPVTSPAAAPVTSPAAAPGTPSAATSALPAPASPSPASGSMPTATPDEPVRRIEDPAAEQRLPGAETAKSATPAASAAPGAGPEITTPAGPAPLIAPPDAAGARPAETGTPAPDAEPPAPEGEAPARETPQVPDDVQEYLDASRGKGAPLPDATLRLFEDKFQRPFDDVRIHDDGGADDAARKIDALAFTRGNDIYFRSGAYDPTSQQGKKLLAHELAHVVQQRPGINRKAAPGLGGTVIRRAGGSPAGGSRTSLTLPDDLSDQEKTQYRGPSGKIDTGAPSLELEKVYMPEFKVPHHVGRALKWNPAKRPDAYRAKWAAEAGQKLASLVPARALQVGQQAGPPFYFERTDEILVFGTPADIGNALSTIPWEKKPTYKNHEYQIDHKHEFQLGGPPDDMTNLWLLDAKTNAASGGAIKSSIDIDIKAIAAAAAGKLSKSPPDVNTIKKTYALTFKTAVGEPNPRQKSDPSPVWTKKLKNIDSWEIEDFDDPSALTPLRKMKGTNIAKVTGKPGNLIIVTRRGDGKSGLWPAPYDAASREITVSKYFRYGAFKVTKGKYYLEGDELAQPGKEVGEFVVDFFPGNKNLTEAERTFKIIGTSGVNYGGFLDTSPIRDLGKSVSHKNYSPLEFLTAEFDFERGVVARAKIPKPSISLLENVELDVVITGEDVGIEATITGGELKLPGPFKVTGGSLTLSVTTGGAGINGQIDFEIEKLATGSICGAASAKAGKTGFAVGVELNFDSKMFDRGAQVSGSYKDGDWALEGKLGVGPKAIKGIKEASVHVQVTKDAVTADGEFETSLKGVDKGTLGFKYNEATGMEITGEIILGKGIPGIKSGKLDATIKEGPDGHSLNGGVTLEPSVPGLAGTVTGQYEDGAFFVQADLGYEKGLAKGKVNIGLTNQAVGEDGKPAGPPKPDGSITAFGTGLVELALTPWLKGTVGLKLTPTGEIEVSGEVALPSEFRVFGPLPLDKELFSVSIDIPIVGVSVAGVHVGIFATVGGGASISAGVGPGVLRGVALKVTYNPDRPDDTTVTGTGSFVVPAHASLRLTVGGGVGVGIPLVDATAKLNAHGEIGVAGEALADVQVNWAPATGIVLDAHGDIFVEPKFKFGVDASVNVTVGVWRLKKTLYEHTWCLADFEFGSNLRFGLSLPIHYESLKPFDISFDQIQWTYPQIEPKDLLSGLMEQLVSGPAKTPEC